VRWWGWVLIALYLSGFFSFLFYQGWRGRTATQDYVEEGTMPAILVAMLWPPIFLLYGICCLPIQYLNPVSIGFRMKWGRWPS